MRGVRGGVETVVNSGFRGEGKDEHLVGTNDKQSLPNINNP